MNWFSAASIRTPAVSVRVITFTIALSCALTASANATFSICAVDTVTGAVGSAGATCGTNAFVLTGPIPGVGVVHTQAFWNRVNQNSADSLMRVGLTPDSIIGWLVSNDAENDGVDHRYRQYGVVTLANQGASAAYTGGFTDQWHGHRTGPGYAIQGNIIMDSLVITRMETAYLNTGGPMEDRLMAALQAAKYPGSDTRCAPLNKSTISAFVRVAYPDDGDLFYLDEAVHNTPDSVDPIDVLQDQFDTWKTQQVADPNLSSLESDPVALPTTGWDTAVVTISPLNQNGIPPTRGVAIAVANTGAGSLSAVTDIGDGTHTAILTAPTTAGVDTISAEVDAGGQVVSIAQSATIIYFLCGDATFDGAVNSADVIYMVNHVFKGGFRPEPVEEVGDVNRSSSLTSADIIYMVQYVFKGGPAPCP